MLTDNDLAELAGMTHDELVATARTMERQVGAPLFIGDKDRSRAVRDEALRILAADDARWMDRKPARGRRERDHR